MDMSEMATYWSRMTDEQQRRLLGFLKATATAEDGRRERPLTVPEVASETHISPATINRAINAGDLHATIPRGTRLRLVRRCDLEDWLDGDE